ncbi:MAG: hypothetical protein KBH71_07200, partial [Anaerolineae bacterium]|nr:hypothetical protein [Anaerolineae bacterium]
RLQSPIFFLPLPNGVCAVGEGAGGGAKATGHKGSFIAVWHPGTRLNSHRTFSSLDDVRQHMASPSKIEISESAKKRKGESAKKRKGE